MQRAARHGVAGWAVAIGIVAAGAGCAGAVEPPYPRAQGWVGAQVVAIDTAFEPPLRPGDDCRRPGAPAGARYAEVRFHWQRSLRRRIVRLPETGVPLRVGDVVQVNALDCGVAAAP